MTGPTCYCGAPTRLKQSRHGAFFWPLVTLWIVCFVVTGKLTGEHE